MGDVLDAARAASEARLDGPRSTVVFRVLLDALARPGCIRTMPAEYIPSGMAPAALLPLALADLATSVCVTGALVERERLAAVVRGATAARIEDAESAAIVVSLDGDPMLPERLRAGSDDAPESAARLGVQVDTFDTGEALVIDGPGIAEPSYVQLGLDRAFVAALQRRNRPPVGLDTWIFDRAGNVIAIPRSTRMTLGAPTAHRQGGF